MHARFFSLMTMLLLAAAIGPLSAGLFAQEADDESPAAATSSMNTLVRLELRDAIGPATSVSRSLRMISLTRKTIHWNSWHGA